MLEKIFVKTTYSDVPIEYHPKGLNIFVGPNNSGKSLLLREIHQDLTDPHNNQSSELIDYMVLSKPSTDLVNQIFKRNADTPGDGNDSFLTFYDQYNFSIGSLSIDRFNHYLNGEVKNYKGHEYFTYKRALAMDNILLLNGATRLQSMGAREYSTLPDSKIINPINSLLNNDKLYTNAKSYIFDAFGLFLEIFLDGGNAKFVLSKKEMPDHLRLSVKPEATSFLLLNSYDETNSSDGRKAYLGIISEIIAGDPNLLLLDEPEAFLHPPLARKLGNVVSKLISSNINKQIFIGTHSADFIMGCIESHVPINIVRLTYENERSTFRPINQEILERIMNNPLLKSTNILKAIFYQKVVVTESDSDRAFYEEVNSRLLEYKPEWGIKECLFLNAQNKQTTGIIVKTLREIGVSAVSIVDLDFIKDGKGEFSDKYLLPVNIGKLSHSGLQSHRTTLKDAFDRAQSQSGSKKPELMKADGLESLKDIDPEAYTMGYELLDSLNLYGLFPVPTGELESWLKPLNVDSHGSNWLTSIFEKMGDDPKSDSFIKPSDNDVWKFIASINDWFNNPDKKGMYD